MTRLIGATTCHELKTWRDPFSAVWKGIKTYEVRRDDRGFKVYDRLLLREWDIVETYTGREIEAEVVHVTHGPNWGLPEWLCVMGIRVIKKTGAEW